MNYSIKTMLLATALAGSLAGCIKEDRSECNPGVLLKYDYSLNTEHANLFGAEVGKVTVYAFDGQGLYYGSYVEEGAHLTNDYRMLLPLPAGEYTLVTWGGALGTYRVGEADAAGNDVQGGLKKGVTHIDDFLLTAEREGEDLRELDDLYHGRVEATSVYMPEEAVTVDLMKDTKHLTVTVVDGAIAGTKAGGEGVYEVYCEGTNGRYRADNSFGEHARTITNRPYEEYTQQGRQVSKVQLLRLVMGRAFRLVVKNGEGKKVFDKDLVEAMLATGKFKTQEDFDRELEYDVVVKLDRDVVVSVTVNGWELVEIRPGM